MPGATQPGGAAFGLPPVTGAKQDCFMFGRTWSIVSLSTCTRCTFLTSLAGGRVANAVPAVPVARSTASSAAARAAVIRLVLISSLPSALLCGGRDDTAAAARDLSRTVSTHCGCFMPSLGYEDVVKELL